jgi:hypothetical protein
MGLGATAATFAGLGKPAMAGAISLRMGATTSRLGSTHDELFGLLRSADVGSVFPAVGLLALRGLGASSIAVGIS